MILDMYSVYRCAGASETPELFKWMVMRIFRG